jgi:transporter family protein
MEWFLPALGSLVFYGFWAFFPKIASLTINPKSFLFYNVIGSVVVNFIIFFVMKSRLQFEMKGFIFSILTGVFGILGTLLFAYALGKGKASVVIIITALYPIISIILSIVFLKEVISIRQFIGMALGMLAVVLISKP